MKPNLLARAIVLAASAHLDQRDLQGEPYILHSLRVMLRARAADMRLEAQAAAVLHDVVEDTAISPEFIESEFGPEVRRLVERVTRIDGEPYKDFIERCATDPETRLLKIYDVTDNLSRFESLPADFPPEKTARLRGRYADALLVLGKAAS